MLALERQKRILEILNADGSVLVSKLSEELDVTEETIRRDLEKLEKNEIKEKTSEYCGKLELKVVILQ